jgi:hypothetical protein
MKRARDVGRRRSTEVCAGNGTITQEMNVALSGASCFGKNFGKSLWIASDLGYFYARDGCHSASNNIRDCLHFLRSY